jgi:hypothetical protein
VNRQDRRRHRSRSAASFEEVSRLDIAPDAKQYSIDCPHSRTFSIVLPGPAGYPSVADQIGMLLAKRRLAGDACACTDALVARYGATWPSSGSVLWVSAGGGV